MSRCVPRARSSSDCAQLLRFAPAAFVPARGTLAVARVRSRCVVALELGRPGSIWLARGTVRATFSFHFRSFSGPHRRSDGKGPTCNPYRPWRVKSTFGPPPSDAKSIENRFGKLSRTTVRQGRSEKASRARPGVLFGRSGRPGSSPERPGRSPGASRRRPGASPKRPWSAPGNPRTAPDRPGSARKPPGPILARFRLRFGRILVCFPVVRSFVLSFVCSFVRFCTAAGCAAAGCAAGCAATGYTAAGCAALLLAALLQRKKIRSNSHRAFYSCDTLAAPK